MTLLAPRDTTTAATPRQVVLVSDSPVVLAGLRAVLTAGGVHLRGVVRDHTGLARKVRSSGADTVLAAPTGGMDEAFMSVMTGELAAVRTVVLLPPTGVVIHAEAMRAFGTNAVLSLTAEATEIVRAVSASEEGPVALDVKAVLAGAGGRLTTREQEVLDRLAAGRSNREIAAEMVLSEETIKSHLTRVYRKLGVRSRAEAITAFLEVT